jgi:hypothetical protein
VQPKVERSVALASCFSTSYYTLFPNRREGSHLFCSMATTFCRILLNVPSFLRLRFRAVSLIPRMIFGNALLPTRGGRRAWRCPSTSRGPGRCPWLTNRRLTFPDSKTAQQFSGWLYLEGYTDLVLDQNTVTVEVAYDERDKIIEEAESRNGRVARGDVVEEIIRDATSNST